MRDSFEKNQENPWRKKPGRVPKSATGGRRALFNLSGETWTKIEAAMTAYNCDQTAAVERLVRDAPIFAAEEE